MGIRQLSSNDLVKRLRETGHKITPQRMAVWEILKKGKHLTADMTYRRVYSSLKFTDASTVYRTIELFTELRLIRALLVNNLGTYYEVCDPSIDDSHAHFICTECGGVTDVDLEIDDASAKNITQSFGKIDRADVMIYGNCRGKENAQDLSEEGSIPDEARLIRLFSSGA